MKPISAALALTMLTTPTLPADNPVWVYFGTYTRGADSEGIYFSKLDLETGALTPPVLVAKADNPSFVAMSPDGRSLYAVEETGDFEGESSGALRSFTIDASTGALTAGSQSATAGAAPCHVSVCPAGKQVFFANYTGGSAGAYAAADKGTLGVRTAFHQHEGSSVKLPRQSAPHAHAIDLDPAGRFAFVADLGLDQLVSYRYDSITGGLEANDPPFAAVPPGGGPRHLAFRPDAKFVYTNNEITSSVTAFSYDAANGVLSEIQTISTLPDIGFEGNNSTAEIAVHPSGRFLYVSNRGHDSIAVFQIAADSGKLVAAGHTLTGGKTPRGFGVDPTGRYLLAANQNSNNVAVFRIDPSTGTLTATGAEVLVSKQCASPSNTCQAAHLPNSSTARRSKAGRASRSGSASRTVASLPGRPTNRFRTTSSS